MEKRYLIIIGSGPAAYTAAIYSARAQLNPLIYEGFMSGVVGGQLMTTTEIENFPGFPEGILGPNLMENMKKQAIRFGSETLTEDVLEINFEKGNFHIKGTKTESYSHAVIIATGATAKRMDILGTRDNEYWQKGVSACAICDGAAPIFRNKDLYVIGGGDSAVEEAIFLTKYANTVYLVHRRDELRASKIMQERAMKNNKIKILWNKVLVEVLGNNLVTNVILQDVKTNEKEKRDAAGVFFAIGHKPNTDFLKGMVDLNEYGYIKVKKGTSYTSKAGIFAAGDVQDSVYRQAVTAAGSGCMAAIDAERWLSEKGYFVT